MVSVLPCTQIEHRMNNSMLSPQRNSFRPKKKLARVASGREHCRNITQQFSFPPQLYLSPKVKVKKAKNDSAAIPHIVIDTVEDEKTTQISKRRGSSFTRPGLNCNAKLLHPSCAVCSAVSANDPSALKNIILTGTVNIDQVGTSGATALHEASYDGKIACVNTLIQCGADVNVRDREGWTPLHAAVCGQSRECAEQLVCHGASVKAKSYDGLTPLAIAMQQKDQAMMKLLASFNKQKLKDRSSSRQAVKESLVLANI